MAAGDYIIPGAQAVTERGIGFINSCGEAALAVVQGIANGTPPTIAQVVNLVKTGTQFGTAPSGTSTPQELANLSAATGTPLTIGSGQTVLSTVNSNLAVGKPTEIGVSNARAFGGADSNVFGHYVTVVGRAASGSYIVADPNQPASVSGQFVQYTPSQITAANPFATLTPANIPLPTNGLPISGITAAPLGGLFTAFNTTPADFAWRAGLILGGMVLIVYGLLIFFGHQETEVVNQITSAVSGAARTAATAAAA